MLTPFGLYNLKHDATPTFLSSFLPNAVYGEHANPLGNSQRLYGKFATGIQVLGIFITDSWSGEYHVFASNGSGPKPAKQDNNTNKAVGYLPASQDLRLAHPITTKKTVTQWIPANLHFRWIWHSPNMNF